MCQQEGIGDDDQFDSVDHQEVDRAGEEVGYHHQEVLDEEDKLAGGITDTCSVTARFAAAGCRA